MNEVQLRDLLMDQLPDRKYKLVFAGKVSVVNKDKYIDYIVMMTAFFTDIELN